MDHFVSNHRYHQLYLHFLECQASSNRICLLTSIGHRNCQDEISQSVLLQEILLHEEIQTALHQKEMDSLSDSQYESEEYDKCVDWEIQSGQK